MKYVLGKVGKIVVTGTEPRREKMWVQPLYRRAWRREFTDWAGPFWVRFMTTRPALPTSAHFLPVVVNVFCCCFRFLYLRDKEHVLQVL